MTREDLEHILKIPGVVECRLAGVYVIVVVQPGKVKYTDVPLVVKGSPIFVIDEGSECHKANYIKLSCTEPL